MNSDKSPTPTKIPDLYHLLRLPAKEGDEQTIKAAMRTFAERAKLLESPEAAKEAIKIFNIAKNNLLDPKRKAAYDSLWDRVYGARVSTSPLQDASIAGDSEAKPVRQKSNKVERDSIQEPSWDMTELNSLLPHGDVNAPLDLAAFLGSADAEDGQRSTEDLERDFQRLASLLGGELAESALVVRTEASPISATIASVPFDFSFAAPNSPANVGSLTSAQEVPVAMEAVATTPGIASQSPANSRSNPSKISPLKARKNRDRTLLVMIAGGLTVLLSVLSVLVVMLNRKEPAKLPDRILAGTVIPRAADNRPQGSGLPEPVKRSGLPQPGSGLPQPGEQPPAEALQPMDGQNSPTADDMAAVGSLPGPVVDAPANPLPGPDPTTTPTTTPPSVTVTPTAPPGEMPPAMPAPAAPVVVEPEPKVELTDKEKSDWKKLLRNARNQLGNHDFDKARKTLDEAGALAKSSQQKAQLARLTTIFPLVEQFCEAMKSAATDMDTAEVFKAGSQDISFVEATEERISVRIRGASKRYQWVELPIVLAYGLAELKLDQSPQSTAAKAAFAAVHSKLNNTAKEDARKLMQAAAAANAVPADAHEIFDDDYSLD